MAPKLFLVSADETIVTAEEKTVRDYLQQSVDEFSTNQLSSHIMRRFASDVPGIFAPVAVSMLVSGTNSPGFRYLAMLVVWQPTLFRQLSNPWIFTCNQAVTLAKKLMDVDPSLDVRFSRQLPARSGVTPDTLSGQHAERALDIIDQISPGRRVVPILSHLANHPDHRISSKATLLVGRRVGNISFAKRLIAEGSDPRVRANAIEAVWGEDMPGMRQLLWDCVEDRHNRVVGNAMVGLYLLGDQEVTKVVKSYATDRQHEFRMTAAWTIGRMGEAAFVPMLAPLVKDAHPGVRGAALRALQNIRQIENERRPTLVQVPLPPAPTVEPRPAVEAPKPAPVVIQMPEPELRLDGKQFSNPNKSRFRKLSEW